MLPDIYQAECERIANQQAAALDGAKLRLQAHAPLSPLEQGGVLHAVQVLAENAIGKTKHWLKALGQPVPISAHDAFESLHLQGCISQHDLNEWRAIVGLRNRIVHDYLNVDPSFINGLILQNKHHFIADFLRQKIGS
nr:DUF86 domain-containing protein [uncultured Limnohabitans sp.]